MYVLRVHTAQDHDAYDVLDVGQWELYVLPRAVVAERAGDAMPLAWVQEQSGGATAYAELIEAVRRAGGVEP